MPSRGWLIFTVVSVALLASSMQMSMVAIALPELVDGLDAPLAWVGWVLTIFTLAQAVAMPITGKLSDELGRKRVFVGGVLLFGLGSLLCGIAPNIYVLIGARLLQGLAGGSLLPSAYGIVGDAFVDTRARMLGLISSVFPIGSILGPTLGGVLVEHFSWRWTFIVNAPIALLVALLAIRILPVVAAKGRQSIDFVGVVLLSLAVLGIVYALTEVSHRDRDPNIAIVVMSVVIGLIAGTILLRYESRIKAPLLDTDLLFQRPWLYLNALNFVYGTVLFGVFSFIPLYAQTAYGFTESQSGFMLTPRALLMIGSSATASFYLHKTGYRSPIQIGLTGMAILLAVLSFSFHGVSLMGIPLADGFYLTAIVSLTGLMVGIAGPASNNGGIELIPDRIAAVTGIRGMFRSVGGTLGTAIMVLIISRAPDEATGIERSFLVLSVAAVIAALMTLGIPARVERRPPPPSMPQESSALPAPSRAT